MKKPNRRRKAKPVSVPKDEPPKTLTVPEAGRIYFGLARAAAYAAAKRGDFPTIQLGKKLCVSVVALEQMLLDVKPQKPTAPARREAAGPQKLLAPKQNAEAAA